MNRSSGSIVVFLALAALATAALANTDTANTDAAVDPRLREAEALYRKAGPEAALSTFERLAAEFRAAGETRAETIALHFVGESHWQMGNLAPAREFLDHALGMSRASSDRRQEAKTLNVLGLLEWDFGHYDQAAEYFRTASAVGEALGDRKLVGATLNNLSLVYDDLGEYQTSLAQYERVLAIYDEIDFPRGRADTLSNIGRVHMLLGRYRTAIDFFDQALEISRSLESKPGMSQDYGNLAISYLGLGNVDRALGLFDEAIRLAEETGMRYGQAYWLGGKGNALVEKGRYDDGLAAYRTMLSIYESEEARAELVEALHDIGELHMLLGDLASAEAYFRESMAVARRIDRARNVTVNLVALGDLELRRDRRNEAAVLFDEARQEAARQGDEPWLGISLLRLAQTELAAGRPLSARPSAEKALGIGTSIEARTLVAEAEFTLAETDLAEARPAETLERLVRAEAAFAGIGNPELAWQIAYCRGRANEALGDMAAAVDSLTAAVEVIEGVRDNLAEARFRSGYLQDKHQVYVELVRLQLKLDRTGDAFATAERLRARSFATQVERSGRSGAANDQERRAAELRERIRQLQRALFDEESRAPAERRNAAVQAFSHELMAAQREYQALLDDLGSVTGGVVFPVAPSSTDTQQRLGDGDMLIEYVLGEDNLVVFTLSRAGLSAEMRDVGRADIARRIELLRDLIATPDDHRWRGVAATLAAILVEPLESDGRLEGVSRLYIVPHGVLNYLPFSLLGGDGADDAALIDRFALAYLPSAAALATSDRPHDQTQSVLAMAPAVSRLRFAPEEARTIDALFRPASRLFVGENATESAFKDLAGDYRMLHLATHGYFDRFNPLFSGVRLEADGENDGLLEVHEIFDLELDAELVTLSACDTALAGGFFADVPAGDEFLGLTQAFLSVGSDSVIATLWQVDDRSSVVLMRDFYSRLGDPASGGDKAAALRAAQQELRATDDYQHPYYWAPFVFVGNARTGGVNRQTVLEAAL